MDDHRALGTDSSRGTAEVLPRLPGLRRRASFDQRTMKDLRDKMREYLAQALPSRAG